MKGLMRKNFYMLLGYCKSFLLLIAVFLGIGWMDSSTSFMTYYPGIMSSVVVTTIIGYDEREKWDLYSAAMPYTKAQIVSGYYLMGLFTSVLVVAASLLVRLAVGTPMEALGSLATLMVTMGLIPSAVLLPFLFRFGAEKGRVVYGVVLGIFIAALGFVDGFSGSSVGSRALPGWLCLASAAVYAASWLLSIRLYRSREI